MVEGQIFVLILFSVIIKYTEELPCDGNYYVDANFPDINYVCSNMNVMSYSDAITFCKTIDSVGNLPVFHSEDEYQSFVKIVGYKSTPEFCQWRIWLGLEYNDTTQDYLWNDGYPLQINHWQMGSYFDNPTVLSRVNAWFGYLYNPAWTNVNPSNTSGNCLCQIRSVGRSNIVITEFSTSQSAKCPSNDWYYDNQSDICYIIGGGNLVNMQNASDTCNTKYPNSTLPLFLNYFELVSFERSFLDITCESFFWLGYKSKTIGSYGLVDGLSNDCQVFSNYSSWSDDQCTTYFNYGPEINFGPCLANQLPFMCQYRPNVSAVNVQCSATATSTPKLSETTQFPTTSTTSVRNKSETAKLSTSFTTATSSIPITTTQLWKVTNATETTQLSKIVTNITSSVPKTTEMSGNSTSTTNIPKTTQLSKIFTNITSSVSDTTQWKVMATTETTRSSKIFTSVTKPKTTQLSEYYTSTNNMTKTTQLSKTFHNITSSVPVTTQWKVISTRTSETIQSSKIFPNAIFNFVATTQLLKTSTSVTTSTSFITTRPHVTQRSEKPTSTPSSVFKTIQLSDTSKYTTSNVPKLTEFWKTSNVSSSEAEITQISETYTKFSNLPITSQLKSSIANKLESTTSPTFFSEIKESTTNKQSTIITETPLLDLLQVVNPTLDGGQIQVVSQIQDAIPFVTQSLDSSLKRQIGYSLEQVVFHCSYNGIPCNMEEDFYYSYNPLLGNCFTFNFGYKYKYSTYQAGSKYGLKLTMSGSQNESSCSSMTSGFKIVIHENNVQPFPDSEGFNVPSAVSRSFGLRQTKLSRLDYPYGVCSNLNLNGFSTNYSVEACQQICYQQKVLKTCKCVDPRYLQLPNSQYCGPSQKSCLDYMMCESSIMNNCHCPAPCEETMYKTTLTTVKLLNKDFKHDDCLKKGHMRNCSTTDASEIVIYFQEIQHIAFAEVPAYSLLSLFLDTTNVAGIMLGIDMVTFVELGIILFIGVTSLFARTFFRENKYKQFT